MTFSSLFQTRIFLRISSCREPLKLRTIIRSSGKSIQASGNRSTVCVASAKAVASQVGAAVVAAKCEGWTHGNVCGVAKIVAR